MGHFEMDDSMRSACGPSSTFSSRLARVMARYPVMAHRMFLCLKGRNLIKPTRWQREDV